MFKVITDKSQIKETKLSKIADKLNINVIDINAISYDKFLFSYIFLLAISKNKLYLKSTDNKQVEIFELNEIKNIVINNKTDLNLILNNGRSINLTSVVGVKKDIKEAVKVLQNVLKNN